MRQLLMVAVGYQHHVKKKASSAVQLTRQNTIRLALSSAAAVRCLLAKIFGHFSLDVDPYCKRDDENLE